MRNLRSLLPALILALVLLALAGYAWRLNSEQGALRAEMAGLKGALAQSELRLALQMGQAKEDLTAQVGQVETGLSSQIAQAQASLEEVEQGITQAVASQQGQLGEEVARREASDTELRQKVVRLEGADIELRQEVAQQSSQLGEEIEAAQARLSGVETQTSALGTWMDSTVLDAQRLYKQSAPGVVMVEVTTPQGEGQGSGFLYGAEGRYIVTAHHVVAAATRIKVVTSQGEEVEATVAASRPASDIAVLRLAQPLAAASLPLGDSSQVEVGQPALVLGSPFGYILSAAAGIVSNVNIAVSYPLQTPQYFIDGAIQFDAAANVGNSGSPLLNVKGEVIGLVVAGVNPGEGWGLSFAVSSSAIRSLVDSLPR